MMILITITKKNQTMEKQLITKKPVNYVEEEYFSGILKKHIEKVKQAKIEGKPEPKISDEIGSVILEMATRMTTRYNFHSYTFHDDMISDGVLDAIKAVPNYNPDHVKEDGTKTKAYSYFNFIIWRAFLRRIAIEKKEHKFKMSMMPDVEAFVTEHGDEYQQNNANMVFFLKD